VNKMATADNLDIIEREKIPRKSHRRHGTRPKLRKSSSLSSPCQVLMVEDIYQIYCTKIYAWALELVKSLRSSSSTISLDSLSTYRNPFYVNMRYKIQQSDPSLSNASSSQLSLCDSISRRRHYAALLIQLCLKGKYAAMLQATKNEVFTKVLSSKKLHLGLSKQIRATLIIQAAWHFSRSTRAIRHYVTLCKIRFLSAGFILHQTRHGVMVHKSRSIDAPLSLPTGASSLNTTPAFNCSVHTA